MSGFRDIHAHLVYGMDDGAQSKQDMEAMLDAAYADGVASLFATPHVIPGIRPFDEALFRARLEEARRYCAQKGYGIELLPGAEIMYTPALETYAKERRIPTLADTQGVLMEFTPRISYDELERAVELMEHCGYITILAHIERYRCLAQGRHAERLKADHDVRYQVNGASVIKKPGLLRGRVLWRWLREGLIDYVATDTHNCGSRATNLTEAYGVLCSRVGREYAGELVGLEPDDLT